MRAIKVAAYFTEHTKAAFRLMGTDPVMYNAARIVEWLKGREEVTKRDIQRARQDLLPRAEDMSKVVGVLVETGHLRPVAGDRRPGRPSERFLVNPLIP